MKKDNSKVIIILLVIIIILLLVFIGLMVSGKIQINLNNNEILKESNKESEKISYNVDDYVTVEDVEWDTDKVEMKKVVLKNLDASMIEKFVKEQDELINHAKSIYEFWKEDNFESLSSDVSSIAFSDAWYQVNESILTVYYEVTTVSLVGTGTDIAVVNIDLKNEKIVSDEELLNMASTNFEDIALKHYNASLEIVKECDEPEANCALLDKNSNKIVLDEYVQNKDNYVNLIVSGLDNAIFCYIEDGIIKYDYHSFAIDMLYLNVGKGGTFPIKTVELGKM